MSLIWLDDAPPPLVLMYIILFFNTKIRTYMKR
jgi:hypothetical protein